MTCVRVKICGITRSEDALAAVAAGADALGFNFWPGSKRYCAPERARRIIGALPPFVTTVGVFVDAPRAEMLRVADHAGVSMLQLHGAETPELCARLGASLSLPLIKAVRVDGPAALRGLRRYPVQALLLDAPTAGYGGSGRVFDWSILERARLPRPVILAGGLTPTNVARAVRAARPFAVDVASGVESAPGIKDAARLARFVQAAKGAR
jgi:phosphoribosylanthranilate isomerase